MGSMISKYRFNYNKELYNRFITRNINTLKHFNIGITFNIGLTKIKSYRYKNVDIPKYYIIFNLPYGCSDNFIVKTDGLIILNRSEYNINVALNKYQSISNVYKPYINENFQIASTKLVDNTNLEDAFFEMFKKIQTLESNGGNTIIIV